MLRQNGVSTQSPILNIARAFVMKTLWLSYEIEIFINMNFPFQKLWFLWVDCTYYCHSKYLPLLPLVFLPLLLKFLPLLNDCSLLRSPFYDPSSNFFSPWFLEKQCLQVLVECEEDFGMSFSMFLQLLFSSTWIVVEPLGWYPITAKPKLIVREISFSFWYTNNHNSHLQILK